MASVKSYNTSPDRERFQRTKRVRDTGSERAASPSEASSAGDDIPGGKYQTSRLSHDLRAQYLLNASSWISRYAFSGVNHFRAMSSFLTAPGVRLDLLSVTGSPGQLYTPPHSRHNFGGARFARSGRRNATESPRLVGPIDRDDVFTSPTQHMAERRTDRSVTIANMQRLDDAVAQDDENALTLRQQTSNLSMRHQINGVDAQNLYPPTACVFVAK